VTSVDRAELAAFLRRRRAAVSPADAGLPAGPRRRTPGLRRQEVAQLAGMSVDYYTRLEQGRGPRPSRQMLGAIGRALRLSGDELAYLHYVAGETPGPPSGPARDVRPGILALLGRLDDTPALVCDAKYDVLAWNAMAAALIADFSALPPGERNIIWRFFTDPAGYYDRLLGDDDRSQPHQTVNGGSISRVGIVPDAGAKYESSGDADWATTFHWVHGLSMPIG